MDGLKVCRLTGSRRQVTGGKRENIERERERENKRGADKTHEVAGGGNH